MEDITIPSHDAETVRLSCLEAATALNCMRDEPKDDAADVIEDAALFEFYVSNGQSVAVYCDGRLAATIRG